MRPGGWAVAGALTLAAMTACAQSQEWPPPPPPPKRFTLTFHPLSLVLVQWQVEFEAAVHRTVSLHANPTVVMTVDDGTPRPLAFAMDVGLRYFPYRRAPTGFFTGVHAGLGSWNLIGFSPADPAFAFRAGASVGYTWAWPWGLVLSTGGGAEVITVSRSVSNDVGVMVYPFLRLAVGVTF